MRMPASDADFRSIQSVLATTGMAERSFEHGSSPHRGACGGGLRHTEASIVPEEFL
jgi:hypothetical protein